MQDTTTENRVQWEFVDSVGGKWSLSGSRRENVRHKSWNGFHYTNWEVALFRTGAELDFSMKFTAHMDYDLPITFERAWRAVELHMAVPLEAGRSKLNSEKEAV